MKRLSLALLLLLPWTSVRADDGVGPPLACIGTDTFFPLGPRWCLTPGGTTSAVTLRFQPDGPSNQTGTEAVTGDQANAAAQAAFGTWSNAPCPNPPESQPDLRWTLGEPYPTRDAGDDFGAGTFNNVVYFIIDPAQWTQETGDSSIVALATWAANSVGFMVTADIAYNNAYFEWRTVDQTTGAAAGCDSAAANCYDIGSVTLHEVGHFIGLGHVSCGGSVMFPNEDHTFMATSLGHNEVAGVCALYPPRTTVQKSQMGEACTTTADCANPLTCLRDPTSSADGAFGWCGQACSSTNDCSIGWVCGPITSTGNFCYPGVHLSGVPQSSAVASASDLCAPCTNGDQCGSGICATYDSLGLCSQQCSAPSFGCPLGFGCVASANNITLCWPDDARTCVSNFVAPLNDVCAANGTATDPNFTINRACQSGLTCFAFAGGTGACVQQCSAVDPTQTCAQGWNCCFGQDSTGHCASSGPSAAAGGCFKIGHAGDSCVLANAAICDTNTQCFSTGDPSLSKCYNVCGNTGACGAGETCVSNAFTDSAGNALGICCDSNSWDASNPLSCVPNSGPCKRQVGVQCTQNSDCASNYCLNYNGGAACSVTCTADSDCPGPNADVNGDGVPDGGSACTPTSGTTTACWPKEGPITPPACATTATATTSGGCGNCRGVAPEWGAMLVMGLLARLAGARKRLRQRDGTGAPHHPPMDTRGA